MKCYWWYKCPGTSRQRKADWESLCLPGERSGTAAFSMPESKFTAAVFTFVYSSICLWMWCHGNLQHLWLLLPCIFFVVLSEDHPHRSILSLEINPVTVFPLPSPLHSIALAWVSKDPWGFGNITFFCCCLISWLPLRDSWESCKSRFVCTGRDEAHMGDLADRALRDAGGHWLDSIPGAIGDTPGRRYWWGLLWKGFTGSIWKIGCLAQRGAWMEGLWLVTLARGPPGNQDGWHPRNLPRPEEHRLSLVQVCFLNRTETFIVHWLCLYKDLCHYLWCLYKDLCHYSKFLRGSPKHLHLRRLSESASINFIQYTVFEYESCTGLESEGNGEIVLQVSTVLFSWSFLSSVETDYVEDITVIRRWVEGVMDLGTEAFWR